MTRKRIRLTRSLGDSISLEVESLHKSRSFYRKFEDEEDGECHRMFVVVERQKYRASVESADEGEYE
jgi:hypothetical protein